MNETKNLQIKQFLLYCETYKTIITLDCERVASQLLKFRKSLVESVLLNGNKKVFKKAIEMNKSKYPELQKLIPYLNHQVCVLFTNEKSEKILNLLNLNIERRFAEEGEVLQEDVYIFPQNTKLDPAQTFGFSSLGIATKITRGQIEILNETVYQVTGRKLTKFQANFFRNLGLETIKSSLKVTCLFENGLIYPPNVLEFTEKSFKDLLKESIENVSFVSLGANYTTISSYNYEIMVGLMDILSISIGTNYEIEEIDLIDLLKNPHEVPTFKNKKESSDEDSDINIHPFNPWDDVE
jgi:large subunit ribosomal protein LP0